MAYANRSEDSTVVAGRAGRAAERPDAGVVVERERELDCLHAAAKRAVEACGSVVVVEGTAGIGKTALLDSFCEDAPASGFAVFRGRGGELERELPYGVMRQFFERRLQHMGHEEHAAVLDGAAAHARTAMGLTTPLTDARSLRGDEAFAARHGLYWLIANLADRQPLALVLDDAHWADRPSLEALAYLVARLDGLRIVLCVGVRTEEPCDPVLAALGFDASATALRPLPLSPVAVGRVLEGLLGSPVETGFAQACHAATGGNPFLLHELASALRADGIAPVSVQRERVSRLGPRTVARSVLLRLAGLPPGADRLARSVAVLGSHAEPSHVTRLAGIEPEFAAGTLDALCEAELLTGDRPLEFVHPIVRAAIYHDMRANERAALHARAAELLIAAGIDTEQVAPHLLASEPRGRADVVQWLRAAARTALQQGVPDVALAWLRRALAEPAPPDVRTALLAEAGSAAWRAGECEHAIKDLGAAVDTLAPGAERARTGLVLAQATWAYRGISDALTRLDHAIADAREEDVELAMQLEAEVAVLAFVAGELPPSVRERLREHERLSGATAGERAVLAACACGRVGQAGTAAQAIALGRRGLQSGLPGDVSAVALAGAYALLIADECAVPETITAEMQERADRDGSVFEFVGANVVRSLLRLHQGRVLEAEADARAVLEIMETNTGHRAAAPPALAVVVEALVERGRLDAAVAELDAAGVAEELPRGAPFSRLRHARARLRLAQNRCEQALADARAVGAAEEVDGALNPGVRWRSVAALAAYAAGRGDEAVATADDQVAIARGWGAASFLGEALRVRAIVGDPRELVERLGETVSVLEGSPARLEHARALVDLGSALRREGLRAAARDRIEAALAAVDSSGADALVARASAELAAMGDRPRSRPRSGSGALTPAERRVADLAARGASNRQIAQALFLTPKTVENHLGRIYHKLGIHARDELASALAN